MRRKLCLLVIVGLIFISASASATQMQFAEDDFSLVYCSEKYHLG